jgi:hypothetical protein
MEAGVYSTVARGLRGSVSRYDGLVAKEYREYAKERKDIHRIVGVPCVHRKNDNKRIPPLLSSRLLRDSFLLQVS